MFYKRGIIFVISAPSGTGKTTLCEIICKQIPDLKMNISHTTRPPRPNEIDGINYYFIDREKFQEMIKKNQFLEWAEVYGNFYGTSRKNVEELLIKGYDVLLEIDTKGAKSVKQIYPESVLIFIMPPSIEELEKRLYKRDEDSETIKKRLSKVQEEISQLENYDYILVNDDLQEAVKQLSCIIFAERLKTSRIDKEQIKKFLKIKEG